MPIENTVSVSGPVAPVSAIDNYPAHDEQYGKGGYRSVDDVTAMNAIHALRRTIGMRVYVRSNGITYRLNGSDVFVRDDSRLYNHIQDTVTTLRAVPSMVQNTFAILKGFDSIGDGYGGIWYWVVGTSSEDLPTVILPDDYNTASVDDQGYWQKLV